MLRQLAAALAACFALAACGGSPDRLETTPDGMTRIVIDYNATANNAQLALGVREGIFARHGFAIEQVPGSGASANSVALLLNGQVQLAVTEITAVPAAVSAGFPVEIVTSLTTDYRSPQGDAFSLVVPGDSPVRSFRDLSGRTVAVNGLRSFFDLTVHEAVRRDGGDPATVRTLAVPFEDQITALRQGRVDAVSTLEPFAGQLIAQGGRSLGNPATEALGPRSVPSVLMGAQQFIDRHPDVMVRFQQAWEEATRHANDHPDQVRDTIVDTTGAPAEAIADLPLPWYVSGIDRRSAREIVRLMVEQGRLDTAPPLDRFTWTGAPDAADLANPPRDLQVTG